MGMFTLLRRWPAVVAGLLIASLGPLAAAAPGPYALSSLGDPPGDSTYPANPTAINSDGVVAGEFRPRQGKRASSPFIFVDGVIHSLGTPLGRVHAGAHGINDLGQVVGLTQEYALSRAFLWQQGTGHIDLGTLGGEIARAYAINNAGTVVGWSSTADQQTHAFAYQDGAMHDIHQIGAESDAKAISPSGIIVGNWIDANYERRAFIYRDGVMQDLDPQLAYSYAFAYGVNDAGQVVGSGAVLGSDANQAVMWQDGVRHELGTLGGPGSRALAINADGQIVGEAEGPASWEAFIYDEGRMWALTSLVTVGGKGWALEWASAINDRGQIVGMGRHNGHYRPFLLTPVPAR